MRQTDSLEVSLDKLDVLRQLDSGMTCNRTNDRVNDGTTKYMYSGT